MSKGSTHASKLSARGQPEVLGSLAQAPDLIHITQVAWVETSASTLQTTPAPLLLSTTQNVSARQHYGWEALDHGSKCFGI